MIKSQLRLTPKSSTRHPHKPSHPPAHSQLKHSLAPLRTSGFSSSFLLTLPPLHGAGRAETAAPQIGDSPERRTEKNVLMHCTAWPQYGFNRVGATAQNIQTQRKLLNTLKLGIPNADIVSDDHNNQLNLFCTVLFYTFLMSC